MVVVDRKGRMSITSMQLSMAKSLVRGRVLRQFRTVESLSEFPRDKWSLLMLATMFSIVPPSVGGFKIKPITDVHVNCRGCADAMHKLFYAGLVHSPLYYTAKSRWTSTPPDDHRHTRITVYAPQKLHVYIRRCTTAKQVRSIKTYLPFVVGKSCCLPNQDIRVFNSHRRAKQVMLATLPGD
jgi:hypothetical protein